jgi:hypothetical protein
MKEKPNPNMFIWTRDCIKKGEDRGYKNVTLETIMNAKADKAVKKITHHVPTGK